MPMPYNAVHIRGSSLIEAAYPHAKRAQAAYPLEAMEIVGGGRLRVTFDAGDAGVTLRLEALMPDGTRRTDERFIPAADITQTYGEAHTGLGNVVDAIRDLVQPTLDAGVAAATLTLGDFSRVADDVTAWLAAAGHGVDFRDGYRPAAWKTGFRWRGEHPPAEGDVCWAIPYFAPAYYPQMSAPQLVRIVSTQDKGVTIFRARVVCTVAAFAPDGSVLIPEREHEGTLPHISEAAVMPRNADTDTLVRLLVDTRAAWREEGIRHRAVATAVGDIVQQAAKAKDTGT